MNHAKFQSSPLPTEDILLDCWEFLPDHYWQDASGNVIDATTGTSLDDKIVRACNSHDELVAALKKIEAVLAESVPVNYKRDCFHALGIARPALRKAGAL